MSRLSYKTLFIILFLLLIPIVFLFRINQSRKTVLAEWFNDAWMYRQSINISSHTTSESNVFITVTVNIGTTSKAQADAGDFRFLDLSGNLLSYYLVSGAGTTAPVFHIQLTSFPAGAQTLYAYYGNPSATNGFSNSDFSPEATNYTIGSLGSEETGGGPIAWWKFDEGVGTTVYDSSSNQNNGVLGTGSSAPTWASEDQCLDGKCLNFNGWSNYLTISNFKTTVEPYTLSFWMKPQKLGYQGVITLNGNGRPYIDIHSNNKILFYAGDEKYKYSSKVFQTSDLNKWFYITMVVVDPNNLNTWKIYINGKDDIGSNGANTGAYLQPASTVKIGGVGNSYYQGFLDDIKIYPYARTAAQIKQDYATKNSNTNFSSSPQSLSDGLVGYWKFDEGTGTTSADSSGNSNTATFGTGDSSPSWSGGKFGVGVSFGGNNYTSINNSSSISIDTQNFTVSTWIKGTRTATIENIISKSTYTGTNTGYGLILRNSQPYIKFWIYDTSLKDTGGTTPDIRDGNYHHLVGIRNSSSLQLFIDGIKILDNPISTGNVGNTQPLIFASDPAGGSYNNNLFSGNIDEVRIYNRALSPDEIKQLYNYAPSPVLYYKLDEGIGTTAFDSSGNNNHGYFYDSPSWITGKIGKALNFDGNNDFLESTKLINLSNRPFTLSTWYKNEGVGQSNNTTIIGNYKTSTMPYANFHIMGTADGSSVGKVLFSIRSLGSSVANIYSNNRIDNNQWHYLTAVRDENNISLYVDGILQNKSGSTNVDSVDSGQLFLFGSGHLTRFTKSQIDDVKIYNYARTPEQILQDMGGAGSAVNSAKIAGPIAWYKFDEGQGSVAANSGSIGSTVNGTISNGSWSNGKNNTAINFNGTTSKVTLNSSINTSNITISAWINPQTPSEYYSTIFSNLNHGTNSGYALLFTNTSLNSLSFYVGTQPVSTNNTGITAGNWYHISATWDGSAAKLFINNKLIASNNLATPAGYNGAANMIGEYAGYNFAGLIDDVKIYNYALSADEIKTDYNQSSSVAFGVSNMTVGNTSYSATYCVPGSTDPCSPPVAEWKFDEGVGTTAYDTSGNNFHARLNSNPTWTQGKIGTALNFNNNSYLSINGSSSLDQLLSTISYGTVEAWVKANNSTSETYDGIIDAIDSGTCASNKGFWLDWRSNTLAGYVDGCQGVTAVYNLSTSKYQHITFTWSSAGKKLFVDGIQITSNTNTTPSTFLANQNILIGYGFGYFDGSIDQVRIFNYARTPAQVAWDFNQGKPVGWWKMDECQGTQVADWSGFGSHGTLSIGASGTQNTPGTCQVGTSAAWTAGATGKFNSSLNFDGSDDYIEVTDNDIYSSNHFSINSWIKWDGIRYAGATSNDWGAIVTKGNYNSGEYTLLINRDSASTNNNINLYINGGQRVQWTPILDTNWHLLTVTYDGSYAKIYFDGQYKNQGAYSALITNTTNNLRLGRQINGSYKWGGQLDDVRIYNYALTQEQIKQVYNGGAVNFN